MFCLDTNVVIDALGARAPTVAARLDTELSRGTALFVSSVVVFELRFGVAKSRDPNRNAARLEKFFAASIAILPLDHDDAAEAGEIRAELECLGKPIGPYDVLIAGQARRRGLALVTANRREFERVPGLATVDWSR
ncbi:MAG: type II toxin-antitoxin system VapC family toxin [Tagaea sp.]|nr:type II toxin-antitoxin system VapC family toxin [Tagaea sp.]